MRTIERSGQFKRDYKREKRGRHGAKLDTLLSKVVSELVTDAPLVPKYRDHALIGDWKDFRECHLLPDLLLIYAKPDADTLELARLGSHAELF